MPDKPKTNESAVREMICISCPLGCRMTVTQTSTGITVTGNTCKRGEAYAVKEMTAPERTVTSSVFVSGGDADTVSVKTDAPIDKHRIFDALALLKAVTVKAPIAIGDEIIAIPGTQSRFVATRAVAKK